MHASHPTFSLPHRRGFMILLMLALQLLAMSAYAQMASGDVLAPYKNFRPAEDLATRVMEGLLGANYTSPFTAGLGAASLFGAIFLVFNVIVFAVGTVWASYGVIAGVVQTAHEGTVLGKRMSAVWMPIRMVTGIGGLVPTFGGFSLSQVVMIVATSWGISFGNYAYDQALRLASNTVTLTSPAFTRADPKTDGAALARAIFEQRLCELAYEQKQRDLQAQGLSVPEGDVMQSRPMSEVVSGGSVVGRAFGTQSDKASCYAVGIKRKQYLGVIDQGGRWGSSLGFRSGAVNYAAINNQVWSSYVAAWPTFYQEARAIAEEVYVQKKGHLSSAPSTGQSLGTATVEERLRMAGGRYASAVLAATQQVDGSIIKQEAIQNMGKYGFFSAGSFYSTFAEANAAIIQASDATEFIILAPDRAVQNKRIDSGVYGVDTSGMFADQGLGMDAAAGAVSFCPGGTNATGNCSIGQALIKKIIDLGTAGAGGSSTIVDPIIALKNIGDYMMTTGEVLFGGAWLASKAGDVLPDSNSTVGKVIDKVPGLSTINVLGDAAKIAAPILMTIAGLMFAVGALCSIYMPMVPFIHWVSALVQYMCIVVQSFAAAPLWALAHLQPDGEGMGQRTEKGYLYLLNLLFRPILMVVGFFAAAALVILLGSAIFMMYMATVASAQGNSVTGLFSIVGYVFLFFVVMNTIVQGLFNLVFELSDDVIGWVGGIGRSTIGREVEGKTHSLFVGGGRFGPQAAAAAIGGGGNKGKSGPNLNPATPRKAGRDE